MPYRHFYKQLELLARRQFPSLGEIPPVTWDFLISPLEIKLPRIVLTKAQAAISALFRLAHSESFTRKLDDVGGIAGMKPANHSILMAYDFHTSEDGGCHLVEVNTNAAGFLFSTLMTAAHQQNADAALKLLRGSILNELKLSGLKTQTPPHIAIVDEDVPGQKMYAEFLMYRDWLRTQGFNAELCEARALKFEAGRLRAPSGNVIDFVYNRLTDFYLEDPSYRDLRQAYFSGGVCLSPNPKEYWLLADKERLVQLSGNNFLEEAGASKQDAAAIREVLIPTFEKSAFGSEEEIWVNRKSLFFKPKRSFGGKSVYRGESVSRKVFERLMAEDILIQKYSPAQKMPIDDPRSVLANWKFDLRFFVYEDQIQLAAARIYQGQVTNFSSAMGGFTLVRFEG